MLSDLSMCSSFLKVIVYLLCFRKRFPTLFDINKKPKIVDLWGGIAYIYIIILYYITLYYIILYYIIYINIYYIYYYYYVQISFKKNRSMPFTPQDSWVTSVGRIRRIPSSPPSPSPHWTLRPHSPKLPWILGFCHLAVCQNQ